MHLVNGTGRLSPGVVKQDKLSGGSVDTTKTRSGPQRVRMSGGERPIGAAKGKQLNTEALCQPPPAQLVAAGGWRRLAVDSGWQLVAVGGWRFVVPWGGPSGRSLTKKKSGS